MHEICYFSMIFLGFFSYYLNKGNTCTLCSNGIDNCLECSDSQTCNKCHNGYLLNSEKKCDKCIEGCDSCQDLSTCKKCDQYHFLNETNKCVTVAIEVALCKLF